jgi:hypothetical protein
VHDPRKVEAADGNRDSEWQLHNWEECAERPARVRGTDAQKRKEGSESSGKECCVNEWRLAIGEGGEAADIRGDNG